MFESSNGNFDIKKEHINNCGDYVITAGITNNGILGKTDIATKVFDKNTITIDMFGCAFYRQFKYKMVTHARVFSLKTKFYITDKQGLFLANSFHSLNKKFGYENMCSWVKIKGDKIKLPIKKNKIDFNFMEEFITKLETQRVKKLDNYLEDNNLKHYSLTDKEKQVLEDFESGKFNWDSFNLEMLFGKSTRGKRLKSDDRIKGTLPFVTAGEANEGISAYVGNDIHIFEDNTITIDMFGSSKYRNYKYGGDDHISVVNTQNLSKMASVFITSAIHKSSYTGEFHYGKNFYPKDADNLYISLPTKNNQPDYKIMQTLISAIQKEVIKDVVLYVDKKLGKSL